jgi:hypothetical protein
LQLFVVVKLSAKTVRTGSLKINSDLKFKKSKLIFDNASKTNRQLKLKRNLRGKRQLNVNRSHHGFAFISQKLTELTNENAVKYAHECKFIFDINQISVSNKNFGFANNIECQKIVGTFLLKKLCYNS